MPSSSVRTSVVASAEHIRHLPGSFFEFKVTGLFTAVFWDMKPLYANGLLGLGRLQSYRLDQAVLQITWSLHKWLPCKRRMRAEASTIGVMEKCSIIPDFITLSHMQKYLL